MNFDEFDYVAPGKKEEWVFLGQEATESHLVEKRTE
jgi:hypothetical protein